jgi:hypothetical protein
VDVVPVANEREYQQKKRDQQQASRFRRVDRVALALVRGVTVGLWGRHADIVAPVGQESSDLMFRSLVLCSVVIALQ